MISSRTSGEMLRLTSGNTVEGKIILRNQEMVKMDTGSGIPITYFLDEIEAIDGIPLTKDMEQAFREAAADPAKAVEVQGHLNSLTSGPSAAKHDATLNDVEIFKKTTPSPVIKPDKSEAGGHKLNASASESDRLMVLVDRELGNDDDLGARGPEKERIKNALIRNMGNFIRAQSKDAAEYTANIRERFRLIKEKLLDVPLHTRRSTLFYCALVMFGAYILCSFPLMKIAKTLGVKCAWTAWVPVLQIFVLLKAATKPLWWIVPLCIPGVGVIVIIPTLIQFVKNLNRPLLFAVLLVVPGINVLALWYLAFFPTKAKQIGRF